MNFPAAALIEILFQKFHCKFQLKVFRATSPSIWLLKQKDNSRYLLNCNRHLYCRCLDWLVKRTYSFLQTSTVLNILLFLTIFQLYVQYFNLYFCNIVTSRSSHGDSDDLQGLPRGRSSPLSFLGSRHNSVISPIIHHDKDF